MKHLQAPEPARPPRPLAGRKPVDLFWSHLASLGVMAAAMVCLAGGAAWAQTVFLNFDNVGDYTNNFNWTPQGSAGPSAGPLTETNTGGILGSRALMIIGKSAPTATYRKAGIDFSVATNITFSVMFHVLNNDVAGNRIQLGIVNGPTVTMNNQLAGYMSTGYKLAVQYNNNFQLVPMEFNGTTGSSDPQIGPNVVLLGNEWYLWSINYTNTGSGTYTMTTSLVDYGADGMTPGASAFTFDTTVKRTMTGGWGAIATNKVVFPAIRADYQCGVDVVDNMQVIGSPVPSETAPYIAAEPVNQTYGVTTNPLFYVSVALSDSAATYLWYTNGVADPNGTSYSYVLNGVTPANVGETFQVSVHNANGTTNSTVAILTSPSVPLITVNPINTNVVQGNSATFSVTALGQAPLAYLWYSNNVLVASGPNNAYTTPPTIFPQNNNAAFYCKVTNVLGSAVSTAATLQVLPIPPIIDPFDRSALSWYADWWMASSENLAQWDGTRDAATNLHSGSLRCTLLMTNSHDGGVFGTIDDAYEWDANIWVSTGGGTVVGSIQFDILIDPSSTPTGNGDFGYMQVGLVNNANNPILGAVPLPLSATNGWTHMSIPVNVNTNFYGYSLTVPNGGAFSGATPLIFNIDNMEVGGPGLRITLMNSAYVAPSGLQFTITNLVSGNLYSVFSSTDLVNWTDDNDIQASGTSYVYTDTLATGVPQKFYQVRPFVLPH